MRKKINLNFLTLLKSLVYLKYLPAIIIKIKNWRIYLFNYIGIKNNVNFTYFFRDGIKIKVDDNINTATIAIVFIKKDYGNVEEGSIIIDIGANIGVYSIFAAKNKNTIVYAFEPMVENFKLLEENIKLNKLDGSILPFNLAVGAKKGKRILYLSNSPFHSLYPADDFRYDGLHGDKITKRQNHVEVRCVSLKDIFCDNKIDHCNILKLDCEGAEFEILYNLPKEYFKMIERIRIEYHDHKTADNYTSEKLAKFLINEGFKIEKFKKESFCNDEDSWFYNIKYKEIDG